MAYSGKTSSNSTSLINTVAWTPKAPTLKPTMAGTDFHEAKNSGMSRTSSPNAQKEKLFEPHPDANADKTQG